MARNYLHFTWSLLLPYLVFSNTNKTAQLQATFVEPNNDVNNVYLI